jgi:hypothetical protein
LGQAVADALAVKVNIGLGGDGHAVDAFGAHLRIPVDSAFGP